MNDSMKRAQARLELLLRDYEQSREDERQGSAAFSNLLAAALASAFAALVILYQQPESPNLGIAFWISVLSPVAILLPTVYAGLLGAISTARSYYLRVLEREISNEMKRICGENSLELVYSSELTFSAFSSVTFATVRASPAHGKGLSSWFLTFVAIVFTAANVMMLNIAYNAMLTVSPWWANVYFIAYISIIAMLAKLVYDIGLNGRAYFVATASEVQKKLEVGFEKPLSGYEEFREKLHMANDNHVPPKDTLGLFPKPDDLVKIIHEIVGAILACICFSVGGEAALSPRRVLALIAFLIYFEAFVYQTRYIVNDILGAAEEVLLRSSDRRGRITERADVFSASRHLIWRMLVIVIAGVPIYYTGLLPVYAFGVIALIIATCLYEVSRHYLGLTKKGTFSQIIISSFVYIFVCFGEPIRLLVGFCAYVLLFVRQSEVGCAMKDDMFFTSVVCQSQPYNLLGVMVLLTFWGVVLALSSVPLTWVLEALCEVSSYDHLSLRTKWKAEGKRHTFYALQFLLSPLGVRLVDRSDGSGLPVKDELSPRSAFGLAEHKRHSWVWRSMHWTLTPWTCASIAAVPLSIGLSASIFNIIVPWAIPFVLTLLVFLLVVVIQDRYFFVSTKFIFLLPLEPLLVFCVLWSIYFNSGWAFPAVASVLSFFAGTFWLFFLTLEYSKTRRVIAKFIATLRNFDKLVALKFTEIIISE